MRYLNNDELSLMDKFIEYLLEYSLLEEEIKDQMSVQIMEEFLADEFQSRLELDDNLIIETLTSLIREIKNV